MGAIAISGTWRTTAEVEDLWRVVTDLATWPTWWPAIDRVEHPPLEGHAPDRARLCFTTPPPLSTLVVTLEVVERDPPNLLGVEASEGPLRGRGTLALRRDPEGGTVVYDVRLRMRSRLFLPVERLLAGATRASGQQRLERAGGDLARLAGGELLTARR